MKSYTRKTTYQKICAVCGKEFKTKGYNALYCSLVCKNKVENAKKRGNEIPLPLNQIELTCKQCGIKFKPTSKFVPNRKFC